MQSKEGVQRLLSRAGCEVESDRAKERKKIIRPNKTNNFMYNLLLQCLCFVHSNNMKVRDESKTPHEVVKTCVLRLRRVRSIIVADARNQTRYVVACR